VAENKEAGWSGGFDAVLGNTPWERIKIQEKEWFAAQRPDIANAAQRRKMITALEKEDRGVFVEFKGDQLVSDFPSNGRCFEIFIMRRLLRSCKS
jgi:hypothetical protein